MRNWVEEREERFLEKIRFSVFSFSRSPYRKLLDWARCSMQDVEELVAREGLEGALRHLREEGVYIEWEEFKGHAPVRRGSRTFHFREDDFHNPLSQRHYSSSSGGTSGTPVRSWIDLEDHAESAPDWAVWFEAHGWVGRPLLFWTPFHTGMANRILKTAKFGTRYRRWFTMQDPANWNDRLRSQALHGLIRWHGRLTRPARVSLEDPEPVLTCLHEMLRSGQRPLLNTSPSAAASLASCSLRAGRPLDGAVFLLGAEPLTHARKQSIERSGALAVPTYGTSECGWIGAQFPGVEEDDEVHLFRDAYAVVGRSADENPATPLLFTNLRRAGPRVLLNTEIGDSGCLHYRPQLPAASELGYDTTLSRIRSFRKITAWGGTLAVADLYPILEERLPGQFGGTLGDYQLIEDQDDKGMGRLRLLVHPRIGELNSEAVRIFFLKEVAGMRRYYEFMTRILTDAAALCVERAIPMKTPGGKVLPVVPQGAG